MSGEKIITGCSLWNLLAEMMAKSSMTDLAVLH